YFSANSWVVTGGLRPQPAPPSPRRRRRPGINTGNRKDARYRRFPGSRGTPCGPAIPSFPARLLSCSLCPSSPRGFGAAASVGGLLALRSFAFALGETREDCIFSVELISRHADRGRKLSALGHALHRAQRLVQQLRNGFLRDQAQVVERQRLCGEWLAG